MKTWVLEVFDGERNPCGELRLLDADYRAAKAALSKALPSHRFRSTEAWLREAERAVPGPLLPPRHVTATGRARTRSKVSQRAKKVA